MIVNQIQSNELELEHYTGSLDFDCNFCGRNAYNNFHLSKARELIFIVCQECLDKAILENKGTLAKDKI